MDHAQAAAASARLNQILPLAARRAALPPAQRELHHRILLQFAATGAPLTASGIAAIAGQDDAPQALRALAGQDLVVLDGGGAVRGAYPFTLEDTPHRVALPGGGVHAMCAVDALAIAPVFDAAASISSRCHVSGAAVRVEQHGRELRAASPAGLCVCMCWQPPVACAAHSLCREMVFLADADVAARWQCEDAGRIELFSLDTAIAFGTLFFQLLLG
jgi:mercuric reductase